MSKSDEYSQMSFDGMLNDGDNKSLIVPEINDDEEAIAPIAAYSDKPIFAAEDITPPIMRLMQGLSPEVQEGSAKPGQWVLSGFEPKESVIAIPIAYAKRREYRDPDTNLITCTSLDGETGVGVPGGTCAECEMNRWTGEGKNRKGPQCVFMYSYLIYVNEFDTGCILNFKRTGLGVGRSLNSLVSRQGFGNVAVKITSKIQTGGKGSYYIPQLTPINSPEMDEIKDKARIFSGM